MTRKPLLDALAQALAAVLLAVPPASALDLESFEKNVSVEHLDNGLTLLTESMPQVL